MNTPPDPDRIAIGVVTPTLNAARYIDRTLESIWSQASDSVEIEHVVVDGGSTDRTIQIVHRYPSRVEVARDSGMYEAINRGLALVRGDVLGYINADDEIAPGAFQAVADAFHRHPDAQWVCGRVEYIDADGRVLGRMKPVRLDLRSFTGLGWSCIPQQTVWARRAFVELIGPFDATYRNCGDYDWYARALSVLRPLILDRTLGRFRLHGENLSYNREAMVRESRAVQERFGGTGGWSYVHGKFLSARLNFFNPRWLIAKKTGRIRFTNWRP